MNTDQTQKLASITDAELLTFTEAQFKAVAHMAKVVAELHGPHMTRHSSRGVLELQSVRANEIMEWLGDLLNAMDGVDDEEDGWMEPIFEEAHRIYGENAGGDARRAEARTQQGG
jgi:hypothetical protein